MACAWNCLVDSSFLWAPPSVTDFPHEVAQPSPIRCAQRCLLPNASCFGGIVSICQKRKPLHRRMSRHCGTFSMGTRRGLAQDSLGFPGDSRGTRWGFSGDSRTFRGTRAKKLCPEPTFQGDSRETTVGFYNIKKGCLDYTCATSGLSGGCRQAGMCASGW